MPSNSRDLEALPQAIVPRFLGRLHCDDYLCRGCAKFPADVETETYWILKQEAEVLQEVMRMMNSLKRSRQVELLLLARLALSESC